jgi:class 3 adenylate cyclase
MLQARIRADLAWVLRAEGREAEARAHAERAHGLAERLGMEPLRAACAAAFVPPGAGAPPPAGLRGEERRLLRGIASGLDPDALASDLLMTPAGIGRLRERVFARIDASGTVEAAAFAHREGLVPARLIAARRPQRELAELSLRAPPVQRREAQALTVFVSDIANSSELIQRLGDESAQGLIQEHNRIVRGAFRHHGGVELQHTGDGFIATFERARDALCCAVRLQVEFESRRLGPPDSPLRVRVGLHQGEPLPEEDRLFGMAMHTAARICGSCEGGEILVSDEALRSAGDGEWAADDLGPVALRGIFEPVSLRRVRWREAASSPSL